MSIVEKPKIYIESSVISFLTSKPSPLESSRIKQEITRNWWEKQEQFHLFISDEVLDEIKTGDKNAAELRVLQVSRLPILKLTENVISVAAELLRKNAVPSNSRRDAVHIAYSAVYCMDYLITWNQKHIINRQKLAQINSVIYNCHFKPAYICTPQQLLDWES